MRAPIGSVPGFIPSINFLTEKFLLVKKLQPKLLHHQLSGMVWPCSWIDYSMLCYCNVDGILPIYWACSTGKSEYCTVRHWR